MAAKKRRQGKTSVASKGTAKAVRAPASSGKVPRAETPRPAAKASAVVAKARKKRASAPGKPAAAAKKGRLRAAPVGAGASKPATAVPGVAALGEGDRAPAFELSDHAGASLSSTALAGRPYVLYFYPKDDTPGCTVEACAFRDALAGFEDAGVRVIGVSPDGVPSHQRFRAKHGLPFTLLADTDKSLASAYGVWALKKNYGREYLGVIRSTFLVGADGIIRMAWRGVRVNGHVAQVQSAAESLS